MLLVPCLALAASLGGPILGDGTVYSVLRSADGVHTTAVLPGGLSAPWGAAELARGAYNATYAATGWDLLEVHATPAATQPADDRAAAVAAGYFEGKATAEAIEHAAINSGIPTFELTPALTQYIAANEQFVAAQTALASSSLPTGHADRRIWYHVDLVGAQLEGLLAGYLEGRAALARPPLAAPLNATGLLLMNMGGDLEDLDDGTRSSARD
jgi:hypothetical protein